MKLQVAQGKIGCMTKIQGKLILVRVSARFELARVRVNEGKIVCKIKRKTNRLRFWFDIM